MPFASASVRRELVSLTTLAWPVVVTQLGLMAMGLVDVAMVGPLGAVPLASLAIGNSLWFALVSLAMGLVLALDPLLSQSYGAGRLDQLERWFWQGLWLALFTGVVMGVLLLDTRWLLQTLGQDPAVVELASEYVATRSGAVVPFLVFSATRSLLNSVDRVAPVMVVVLLANGLNAVLDYGLIYGAFGLPRLGALGAGWTTTSIQWLMCLVLMLWAFRVVEPLDLSRVQKPEPARLWEMVRLGSPIGGQMLAEFGVFAAAGVIAGQLSPAALAAHQIALSLASFNYMVPLGISIAACVRVGHRVGAGDLPGARVAGFVALVCGALVMLLMSVVFLLCPEWLVDWFGPDPLVATLAHKLVVIAAYFQLFDGLQCVAGGCLRGAGDTRAAFAANVLAHWVGGLPLGWALAVSCALGVVGLWWGLVVSLGFAALLLTWRFAAGAWHAQLPQVVIEEEVR